MNELNGESEGATPIESSRVFKGRAFAAFARSERLSDGALCKAVAQMRRGLIDAQLGGGLVKQRIARPGAGKSSGYRTIVVFQAERHTFFVYGFAKNERDNIREDELEAFKKLAEELLGFDEARLEIELERKSLLEVICDEENS